MNQTANDVQAGTALVAVWQLENVMVSYGISCLGSLSAVFFNEMRGRSDPPIPPLYSFFLLIASALSISLRAIFMMHFVGMTAVALYLPTGERVPMYFDPGLTAISAIICSLVVMWAFYFASQDEHWNTIVEKRLQLAQKIYAKAEAKKMKIEQKRRLAKKNTKINKRPLIEENESGSSDTQQENGERNSDIQIMILFDRPWRIVISGLFVAASVLAMHHLGIHSIRMQASYDFDMNIVLLSAVIALVAATAGMFIVFRVLPYYPNDIVKVIASFIIALAVNGMHFTGMAALRYSYAPDPSFSADGLIDGFTLAESILYVEVILKIVSETIIRRDMSNVIFLLKGQLRAINGSTDSSKKSSAVNASVFSNGSISQRTQQ
ncbi:hypothetical protein BJ741DRAFT_672749 [Chytriomyces cf. hyalinus JEL632]|nr:hypothetical protein BJ741DRAFT_672749 [Chytriomyces cf. hyalinus JEL632]